ncbi:MAG: cell division protein FtsW [Rhodospirillales bacterium]|nr:cell division protein FtsW [Alphaproteobacteria bacterium]MCB1840191.1 cell division protein FtsW [Alphaproteobacteria bacterium]MCB9976393.1 cell division protein FtsW [Rhodospirillales bacterium]
MTSAAAHEIQPFSRTDRSFLGAWWWTVDQGLLLSILLLALIGVAMVSTASPPVAQLLELDDYYFLKRQVLILIPALALMLGVSMLAPRTIWRICSLLLIISMMALVATMFMGTEIKGARRWLPFLGMSVQPSEFVKPAFIVVAAWFIALQNASWARVGGVKLELGKAFTLKEKPLGGYFFVVGLYTVIIVLLMLQPDLGMSVIVTSVFGVQIFLSGMRLRYIALILLLGIGLLGGAYMGFEHVRSRVDRFFYPESGDTYQVDQSLAAFRNGGLTGTGPGQGTVKLNLPDAHADFIFPVAGEEFGIFFILFLISLFLFIVLRGFKRLLHSEDMFPILAVGGLLTMFGLQAFVHMGSSVQLLPAKGMTMPFISYGGSSLLSLGLSMGIVLALTRRQGRLTASRVGLIRSSFAVQDVKEEPGGTEE